MACLIGNSVTAHGGGKRLPNVLRSYPHWQAKTAVLFLVLGKGGGCTDRML